MNLIFLILMHLINFLFGFLLVVFVLLAENDNLCMNVGVVLVFVVFEVVQFGDFIEFLVLIHVVESVDGEFLEFDIFCF